MPRQARIDAPGALHHIIVRGIARRRIFFDDRDRDQLLERIGLLMPETQTRCFAWALLPNHFHLLLRTGATPIATVMRRLLTGYAVSFNRRHRRSGHLFQNRYRSILCQEEAYLLELVRYIHLNPLRAALVPDLKTLDDYRYCGHGVVLGHFRHDWQAVGDVLQFFSTGGSARRGYRIYVAKGVAKGSRPDLVGGGLIRSAGGWSVVKALRRDKAYLKGDERILGDGDFVERVLAQAAEKRERGYALQALGLDVERVAQRVAEVLDVPFETVWASGKYPQVVRARSLLCFWAVRELGVSMTEMAQRFEMSVPAISKSVKRGAEIAHDGKFSLIKP